MVEGDWCGETGKMDFVPLLASYYWAKYRSSSPWSIEQHVAQNNFCLIDDISIAVIMPYNKFDNWETAKGRGINILVLNDQTVVSSVHTTEPNKYLFNVCFIPDPQLNDTSYHLISLS